MRLKRTVALDAAVADGLRAQSEMHAPRETGGIIMGVRTDKLIEVTQLVDAGPDAKRSHNRFEPDGPWQRQRVAALYQCSSRTLEYLGDWHSHPRGGRPSALDRSTAERIADTPGARCPEPLFLIITRERSRWTLRAYQYRARRFRRLTVVET